MLSKCADTKFAKRSAKFTKLLDLFEGTILAEGYTQGGVTSKCQLRVRVHFTSNRAKLSLVVNIYRVKSYELVKMS